MQDKVCKRYSDCDCLLRNCRSLIVLHLVDRLIDLNLRPDLPNTCDQFDKMPLPCTKNMWLATTASKWEDEYKEYLSLRCSAERPTVGDLRKSGTAVMDVDFVKDLSYWSKDVDDLGSLLLLSIWH